MQEEAKDALQQETEGLRGALGKTTKRSPTIVYAQSEVWSACVPVARS